MHYIFTIVFSTLVTLVHSECCYKKALLWDAPDCKPYFTRFIPKRCAVKVCGDGLGHEYYYCGVSDCNVFGCSCKGGCIKGNALKNFKARSGLKTVEQGYDLLDPTTWKYGSLVW